MPPPATCKAYTDRYDPCGELEFGQRVGGYPSPGAVKGLPGPVLHLLRPHLLRFDPRSRPHTSLMGLCAAYGSPGCANVCCGPVMSSPWEAWRGPIRTGTTPRPSHFTSTCGGGLPGGDLLTMGELHRTLLPRGEHRMLN